MPSVAFVFPPIPMFSLKLLDRVTFDLCVWFMDIDHLALMIKVKGQKAVGATSSKGNYSLYDDDLGSLTFKAQTVMKSK